jgi:predicted nucleic acid-binding protein
MPAAKKFLDSNVLLYLQSADLRKAGLAEKLARDGGCISVQVLNEIAAVMRRKLQSPWDEIQEMLGLLRGLFTVEPLTLAVHVSGLRLAERYQLGLYDALIVASALQANCTVLYSEDMQDGLLVEKRLRIRNPFA